MKQLKEHQRKQQQAENHRLWLNAGLLPVFNGPQAKNGFYTFRWLEKKKVIFCQVWWHMPQIPGFGRLRQENCELNACLDYTARSYHEKNKN
jgi:hypothetical protein